MQNYQDTTVPIKDFEHLFYLINSTILEIYKNANTILPEQIKTYIISIQSEAIKLFSKIIISYKIDENTYSEKTKKFYEYSTETINQMINEINNIPNKFGKTYLNNYDFPKIPNIHSINTEINMQDNNSPNNIININKVKDHKIENFIEIDEEFNEINELNPPNQNDEELDENKKYSKKTNNKRRLFVLKLTNTKDFEKLKRKICKSYLNIAEAFSVTSKINKTYFEYYLFIRTQNQIYFPFKGYEKYIYKDDKTPNNHLRQKILRKGYYEKII